MPARYIQIDTAYLGSAAESCRAVAGDLRRAFEQLAEDWAGAPVFDSDSSGHPLHSEAIGHLGSNPRNQFERTHESIIGYQWGTGLAQHLEEIALRLEGIIPKAIAAGGIAPLPSGQRPDLMRIERREPSTTMLVMRNDGRRAGGR